MTDEAEWLVTLARGGTTLPRPGDPYVGPMRDYGREDRYLRHGRSGRPAGGGIDIWDLPPRS